MALKAGTTSDFAGSMANAMMEAFKREYPIFIGGPAPADTEQMKLLFVAVAQGLVQHLNENPQAFKVQITSGGNNYTGVVNDIETS